MSLLMPATTVVPGSALNTRFMARGPPVTGPVRVAPAPPAAAASWSAGGAVRDAPAAPHERRGSSRSATPPVGMPRSDQVLGPQADTPALVAGVDSWPEILAARARRVLRRRAQAAFAFGLALSAAARMVGGMALAATPAASVVDARGPYVDAALEPAVSCVLLLVLTVLLLKATRGVTEAAAAACLALVGTLPLLMNGFLFGFSDAQEDEQLRLIAIVLLFPAVFRMPVPAFVAAAGVPLCVTIAMVIFAQGATSSIYFFAVALTVFSYTAYLLLRSRRSAAEVRAATKRLLEETLRLRSLLARSKRSHCVCVCVCVCACVCVSVCVCVCVRA
jgi:hypothetical protein